MSYFFVYLITILSQVKSTIVGLAITLGVVGGFGTIIIPLAMAESSKSFKDEDYFRVLKTLWKFTLIPAFIFCILNAFIPETKDAVAIYAIPKIIESKTINKLDEITTGLLEKYFKEFLIEEPSKKPGGKKEDKI